MGSDSTHLTELRKLRESVPDDTPQNVELRAEMLLEARKLLLSLERPGNVVERVCFQLLETVAVKIAVDLELFKALNQAPTQSFDELAGIVPADPLLLQRLLRCLVSFGAVEQVGPDRYASTIVSKTFAESKNEAAVECCLGFLSPGWLALPDFLKEQHYQNPTSSVKTALAKAYGRPDGANLFEILVTTPYMSATAKYMATFNEGHKDWFEFYPVEKRLIEGARDEPDAVFMVDVGGGLGHQAINLRRQFPHAPGRFIVQDLPYALSSEWEAGVEFQVHDFMTEQVVKGARLYYFRHVPHNWSQETVIEMFTQLRKAMKPGYSRVVINEWVVPEQGASKLQGALDFNMMMVNAGLERTEALHREYLERAGLSVIKIYNPNDGISESVVEAELAE